MKSDHPGAAPRLLNSILANKCPHCRRGDLFVNPNPYQLRETMKMPDHCPVCGQKFELQTGFYFGTGFVSYALTVLIIGLSFVLWWFTIGMGTKDDRVWYWLASIAAVLVVIQPVLQRLARSIWISVFVKYDKPSENPGAVA